jgi:SAM-dependent methyltransferase
MDGLTTDQITRILAVAHFKDSREARQDLGMLYLSYALGFVDLLDTYRLDRPSTLVADVGTGYGWLAIALALRTEARVIAMDSNENRLRAARQIAAILGCEHRIDWIVGSLPHLPFADQAVDVTFCVEVIEHVGNSRGVVHDLGRVTKDLLVITSPNRNFPIIRHDTGLPFCHWLPLPIRKKYAMLCGRAHLQDNNMFWSPAMVAAAIPKFQRESRFLQFLNFRHFLSSERHLWGLVGTRRSVQGRVTQGLLMTIGILFGRYAVHFMPNLASTFRRKV